MGCHPTGKGPITFERPTVQNPLIARVGDLTRRATFSASQALSSILGAIGGNGISAYWYRGHVNFGDLLTPYLLAYYGLRPTYAQIEDADLVCVGSVLQVLPDDYAGLIAGAGLIREETRRFPRAKVLAVRGELTRQLLGLDAGTLLGDPGLLSRNLLANTTAKRYAAGIIPHYVDKSDIRVDQWSRRFGSEVLIIDVARQPKAVLADIASCGAVLSSSLHGLICADSLGVPNAWLSLSEHVIGEGFKFRDYASSTGRTLHPLFPTGQERLSDLISLCTQPSQRVCDTASKLDEAFRSLRRCL